MDTIKLDPAVAVKQLRLRKGDILVIQRNCGTSSWSQALMDAGRTAGINFSVPIVYVDDIDDIAVVRMGEENAV